MLLNLSNHPSPTWPEAQMQTAVERYGSVQDMPFPNIPPDATADEVRMLAEQYEAKIRQLDPAAVHLMGEMTFTFALVNRLQAIGIPCIASTTERIAEERGGQKIVTFRFVRFRNYL
ncbi:MAG: CRISPR-associated protein [Saprospiraceae bacterium]|nr:CRISPR-associated protein [Saprospiraceae bacterium]